MTLAWTMSSNVTTFALIREGASDDGLIPHLRELMIRAGLDAVIGSSRDYKGSVERCLDLLNREETQVDLIFVHRDADGQNSVARIGEILGASRSITTSQTPVVPVVPIQEIEAWLLLDEGAIRHVVGKPSGRQPLGLPRARDVEGVAQPKEVLQTACLQASGTAGRRYREEKRRFPERRRILLERLDIDGPVRTLAAWARLEQDIGSAVAAINRAHEHTPVDPAVDNFP